MTASSGASAPLDSLRVAIVHDYLNQPGGAERVAEVLSEMFPAAPIYTSVYDRTCMPSVWRSRDVRTSFMQRISPKLGVAKSLIPLYPLAFELFDLREYDLVLSSTTAFAKAVVTRPETCHVCYCNNPTRFFWMYHEYFAYERFPAVLQGIIAGLVSPMRVWDYVAAQRVDYYVAGSHNAARRIAKYYRRESEVLHSPIDGSRFSIGRAQEFFLVAARLQPYKRIDLAVEACNRLGLPLHVVGDGPDRKRLQSLAGPTIRFLGRVPDEELERELASCRALIFPAEEDFGLTPLEAQASGRPVIAYGRGGALETVIEGETGVFFREASVESLVAVLADFEDTYDPAALRAHALKFDKEIFKGRMYGLLANRYSEHVAQL